MVCQVKRVTIAHQVLEIASYARSKCVGSSGEGDAWCGQVRDAQGRKMSKSLGNVVDPVDTITEYGTDALRYTLATGWHSCFA